MFIQVLLGLSAIASAQTISGEFYQSTLKKHLLNPEKQAFCYQAPGENIQGFQVNKTMTPASVTKAFTTYVALKHFGPDFRFKTRFEISREGEMVNVHIRGDQDGYLVSEHIFYVMDVLNQKGIRQINRVTFDEKFYLNFFLAPEEVKLELFRLLKPSSWSTELAASHASFVKRAQDFGLSIQGTKPVMSFGTIVAATGSPFSVSESFEIISAPLYKQLKEMNVHSANRVAKALFLKINSVEMFNQTLYTDLNTDEKSLRLFDGSGGSKNYMTCAVSLKLFQKMQELCEQLGLKLQDVISVAGADGGTLKSRFNSAHNALAVMAKTGTLPDIGVSTLAGMTSTQGGEVFFGVFNVYTAPQLEEAKKAQGMLVDEVIKTFGGKLALEHQGWTFDPVMELKLINQGR